MPKPSLQNITPIYNEKILIKVGIENVSQHNRASLVAQMVKNLSVMQETQVQSLGQEGSLEKGITTQYSCLENSMDRGAWWAAVHGVAEDLDTEHLENPLQPPFP